MNNEKTSIKWIRYLITRDNVSKLLFSAATFSIIAWFLIGDKNMTFAMVAGSILVFATIYSFLSYITLGQYREKAEQKFYDAIAYSCSFPSRYNGRKIKLIKTSWSFNRLKAITINASLNSQLTKNAKEWQKIEASIHDSFKLAGTTLVPNFEKHSKGQLSFISAKDSQIAPGGELSDTYFASQIQATLYGLTISRNNLPEIRQLTTTPNQTIETLTVDFFYIPIKYERGNIENTIQQQYRTSETVLAMHWENTQFHVQAIHKGTREEKIYQATNSVTDLVHSVMSTSFQRYSKEGYIFNPDKIEWGSTVDKMLTMDIDFLQSDISRTDNIERFETLMTQGLRQLFPQAQYQYNWRVDAFSKIVTIKAI